MAIQKKALTTHHQVTHLGRRDHVCPHDSCKQPFGYSHLLRRHLGKSHLSPKSASGSDSSGEDVTPTARFRMDIDAITGQAYAARAREQVLSARAFQCPYPHMDSLVFVVDVGQEGKLLGGSQRCEYVFSRAYDLRRHLGSAHGAQTEKGSLDQWVKDLKRVGV
jgi:uncharacterized C2H2 Zn-finger protein